MISHSLSLFRRREVKPSIKHLLTRLIIKQNSSLLQRTFSSFQSQVQSLTLFTCSPLHTSNPRSDRYVFCGWIFSQILFHYWVIKYLIIFIIVTRGTSLRIYIYLRDQFVMACINMFYLHYLANFLRISMFCFTSYHN